MNCPRCGGPVQIGAHTCPRCGASLHYGGNTEFYGKAARQSLRLRDVFSDVFKRHSKEDGERLFMAGTLKTTPHESEMLQEWRKPWVFAWVGGFGILISIALYFMSGYMITSAAFLMVGSFVIPLTALMFYWEMNIPRNIPLYEVLLMFLAGGVLSFFISMLLFQIIQSGYASFAAFCEEPGKLLAAAFFLRKPKNKYILNGILIGGAVGAGFSAIESAGYALNSLLLGGNAVGNVILRGVLSPGGHVVWAALYGGALAMVKGGQRLEGSHFLDFRFLKYFGASVGLHFLWNSGIRICPLPIVGDLFWVLLTIAAWALLFVMLNHGVRQVLSVCGAVPAVPSPALTGGLCLVGLSGMYAGQRFPLTQGDLVFGRDPAVCNVIFPASVTGISRRHCTLHVKGGRVLLTDSSSFGTFLQNGVRLSPGEPVSLENGQRFYLGGQDNLFEIRK